MFLELKRLQILLVPTQKLNLNPKINCWINLVLPMSWGKRAIQASKIRCLNKIYPSSSPAILIMAKVHLVISSYLLTANPLLLLQRRTKQKMGMQHRNQGNCQLLRHIRKLATSLQENENFIFKCSILASNLLLIKYNKYIN